MEKFRFNFYIFLVSLCVLGLVDSAYLTVKHFTKSELICGFFNGCDKVLESTYSSIGFIPVAMLGMLFYSTAIFLLVLSHRKKKKIILQILVLLISGGFVMSLYFVFLQIFVIKAICTYCMVSALTSLTLFVSSALYLVKNHKYYE